MRDISDFRFLNFRDLKLLAVSSSVSDGQGGMTRVGSISLAPRAIILVEYLCCMRLLLKAGSGGAVSGDGPRDISAWRDLGRRIVEARRSLFGLAKADDPSTGAVCGVMGVEGVEGVGGALPLMRVSYAFFEGVMAILARASFMEMDRNRLWAAGLIIGDAEWIVEVS
jgi:hypothetical protein